MVPRQASLYIQLAGTAGHSIQASRRPGGLLRAEPGRAAAIRDRKAPYIGVRIPEPRRSESAEFGILGESRVDVRQRDMGGRRTAIFRYGRREASGCL